MPSSSAPSPWQRHRDRSQQQQHPPPPPSSPPHSRPARRPSPGGGRRRLEDPAAAGGGRGWLHWGRPTGRRGREGVASVRRSVGLSAPGSLPPSLPRSLTRPEGAAAAAAGATEEEAAAPCQPCRAEPDPWRGARGGGGERDPAAVRAAPPSPEVPAQRAAPPGRGRRQGRAPLRLAGPGIERGVCTARRGPEEEEGQLRNPFATSAQRAGNKRPPSPRSSS